MGIKTSLSHSFNWHLKQDIPAGIELNYMNKEDYEFWNGIGKGVDLSTEILSDELKEADEIAEPILSRLLILMKCQKMKMYFIKI